MANVERNQVEPGSVVVREGVVPVHLFRSSHPDQGNIHEWVREHKVQ
jgi:hypothetical protein